MFYCLYPKSWSANMSKTQNHAYSLSDFCGVRKKLLWCKKSLIRKYVRFRQIIHSAKCLFGEKSIRQTVRRQNVRSAKCLSAGCLPAKFPSAKCPAMKIASDFLVVARSLMFVFISHISLVNFLSHDFL